MRKRQGGGAGRAAVRHQSIFCREGWMAMLCAAMVEGGGPVRSWGDVTVGAKLWAAA
jgi:hypothetical protein